MMHSPQQPLRSSHVHAFTLIELLVVVGIIAVLAAILIPGVSKVSSKAREAKKMSIYRQYGIAHNLYAAENDGNVCPVYDKNIAGGPGFQSLLLPYINVKDLRDPFFYYDRSDPIFKGYNPSQPWLNGTGMNSRILLDKSSSPPGKNTVNDGVSGGPGTYFKLVAITNPQYRILIGDCPITTYSIDPLKTSSTLDTTRHGNGKKGMFVLFDGRVVLYSNAQAINALNDPSLVPATQ